MGSAFGRAATLLFQRNRLGFAHLHPPFCIHRIPVSSDNEKLPAASTCFNTLKLPTYSSAKVMKQKLIYAVTEGKGFELS